MGREELWAGLSPVAGLEAAVSWGGVVWGAGFAAVGEEVVVFGDFVCFFGSGDTLPVAGTLTLRSRDAIFILISRLVSSRDRS